MVINPYVLLGKYRPAWLPRRSVRFRGYLVAAALVLACLLAGTSWMTFHTAHQRDLATAWERHTREVLEETAQLRVASLSTLRGERGYLITGDESFLEPYYQGREEVATSLADLRRLVADNPQQLARLNRVQDRVDAHLQVMAAMVALKRAERHEEAVRRIRNGEGRRSTEGILRELEAFDQVEHRLLLQRGKASRDATLASERYQYLLSLIGLLLLAGTILFTIVLRRSLKREMEVRRELQLRATTDELTGLANRRELLAGLDRAIASARRAGRPLSVAVLDIDHFKRVNDNYGHPAGDEVIRRIAELSVEIMRDQDMVGRLGGEEFVIVMPDTAAEQARLACERLRLAIANVSILLPTGQFTSVTLSTGIAELAAEDDRVRLIARADDALYEAKQQGRDRVLLAA